MKRCAAGLFLALAWLNLAWATPPVSPIPKGDTSSSLSSSVPTPKTSATSGWQSFTVFQTGMLTSIQIKCDKANNATLKLYEGKGTGGRLIGQVTGLNSSDQTVVATLPANLYVYHGRQYTFQLSATNAITFLAGGNYPYGKSNLSGGILNPNFEMAFVTDVAPVIFPANQVGPVVNQVDLFTGAFQAAVPLLSISEKALTFSLGATYTSQIYDSPMDSVLGLGWTLTLPKLVYTQGQYYFWSNGTYTSLVLDTANSTAAYQLYRDQKYSFTLYKQILPVTQYRWEVVDLNSVTTVLGDTELNRNAVAVQGSDYILYPSQLMDLNQNEINLSYMLNTGNYPFSAEKSALLTRVWASVGQTASLSYDTQGYLTGIQFLGQNPTTTGPAVLEGSRFFSNTAVTTLENSPGTRYSSPYNIVNWRLLTQWGILDRNNNALTPPTQYDYQNGGQANGLLVLVQIPEAENITVNYSDLNVGSVTQSVTTQLLLNHGFGVTTTNYTYGGQILPNADYNYPMIQNTAFTRSDTTGQTQYTMLAPGQTDTYYEEDELAALEGFVLSTRSLNENGSTASVTEYAWYTLNKTVGSTLCVYPRIAQKKYALYYSNSAVPNIQTDRYMTYNADNGLLNYGYTQIDSMPASFKTVTISYGIDDPVMRPTLLAQNDLTPITQVTTTLGTHQDISTTTWRNWSLNDTPRYAPSSQTQQSFESGVAGNIASVNVVFRTSSGDVLETLDRQGNYVSSKYAYDNLYAVAQATNADIDAWDYKGFESYENDASGTPSASAHTGTGLYDATATRTLQMWTGTRIGVGYQLGCWVKFRSGGSVTLGFDGANQMTFSADQFYLNEWSYVSYTATPNAITTPYITVTNAAIDDASVAPLGAAISADVYEPTSNLAMATLSGSRTTYLFYNSLGKPIAGFDGYQGVSSIRLAYISPATRVDSATPNLSTLTTVSPQGPSTVNWPTNGYASWTATQGAVIGPIGMVLDQTTTNLPLSTAPQLTTSVSQEAFFFYAQSQVTNGIALQIGELTYAWINGTWSKITNGISTTLMTNTATPSNLGLYVNGTYTTLYSNGQIIASANIADTATALVIIAPGSSKTTVNYTFLSTKPQLNTTYLNTAGDIKQIQTLVDIDKIAVVEYLQDDTGKLDTITLPMFYTGGFKFRDSMVTAYNRTTGQMSGDVSAYYPSYGGQPYIRATYDASPAQQLTGIDTSGTITNSNLTYTRQKDLSGDQLAIATMGGYGPDTATDFNAFTGQPQSASVGGSPYANFSYSDANLLSTITYPVGSNIFQRNGDELVTTVSVTDATAPYFTVYDLYNRPVFSGNSGATFNYTQYDKVNRVTEEGIYTGVFDLSALQTLANQMAAGPVSNGNLVWQRRFTYRYTPSSPAGELASIQANNGADTVYRTYSYDDRGRVTYLKLTTGGNTYTTVYGYNNLDNIVQISYTSALGTSRMIIYTYGLSGLLSAIGTDTNPTAYATYTYNAAGQVTDKALGSTSSLQYAYNQVGNVTQVNSPYVNMAYNYLSGSAYQDGYLQSYTLAYNAGVSWPSGKPQDENASLSYNVKGQVTRIWYDRHEAFNFDANGNMSSVTYGDSPTQAIKNFTYVGNRVQSMAETNYTGLLAAMTWGYQNPQGAVSQIHKTKPDVWTKTLAYDAFTQKASKITSSYLGSWEINLQYGPNNERMYKTSGSIGAAPTDTFLYIWGQTQRPDRVINFLANSTTLKSEIHYIWGPDGLTAYWVDNQLYFVIADPVQSTRVVINAAGQVASNYRYWMWGLPNNDTPRTAMPLPAYMGQEFDYEVGFYNFNAREYNPQDTSSFLSPDPILGQPSPYVFLNDNPYLYEDPNGMAPKKRKRAPQTQYDDDDAAQNPAIPENNPASYYGKGWIAGGMAGLGGAIGGGIGLVGGPSGGALGWEGGALLGAAFGAAADNFLEAYFADVPDDSDYEDDPSSRLNPSGWRPMSIPGEMHHIIPVQLLNSRPDYFAAPGFTAHQLFNSPITPRFIPMQNGQFDGAYAAMAHDNLHQAIRAVNPIRARRNDRMMNRLRGAYLDADLQNVRGDVIRSDGTVLLANVTAAEALAYLENWAQQQGWQP